MLRVLGFEDLHVGMRESLMKTVMDSDVVGFARLSGDDNPLHLCDVYAAETRFGQRIAHGLYTASLISAVLGTRLPGPGAVYRSQTLNFHGPVKIGDVVQVVVEVVELTPKGRMVRPALRGAASTASSCSTARPSSRSRRAPSRRISSDPDGDN